MSSFLSTQAYKGSRDFYPKDQGIQDWIFDHFKSVMKISGFEHYNGPMIESFDIYAAKSGQELVEQQLYHFEDRGKRKVAIRPEMTPTLARMVASQFNELSFPLKWFSIPNLWRYERPQRGRLREHWQLNVDILGGDIVLANFEILKTACDLYKQFNGLQFFSIEINHRGITDFFFENKLSCVGDQKLQLSKIVDAKEKLSAEVYLSKLNELGLSSDQIKLLEDYCKADFKDIKNMISCPAIDEMKELLELCETQGIQDHVSFNPSIMRGLDYYTGLVFEAFDRSPDNNRALFGGGRYDNLIGLFGKNAISGVGFGLGDVTMKNFLETHDLLPAFDYISKIDLICLGRENNSYQLKVQNTLNTISKLPLNISLNPEQALKKQLKRSLKNKSRFAVILGSNEAQNNLITIKDLKLNSQKEFSLTDNETISNYFETSLQS